MRYARNYALRPLTLLRILQENSVYLSTMHVKGHQAPSPDPCLPWEANLNIICDSLATGALLRNATANPKLSPNPFCPIQLILQDSSVHSHFRSCLTSQYTAPDLTSYLKQRNARTDEILLTSINWPTHYTFFIAKISYFARTLPMQINSQTPSPWETAGSLVLQPSVMLPLLLSSNRRPRPFSHLPGLPSLDSCGPAYKTGRATHPRPYIPKPSANIDAPTLPHLSGQPLPLPPSDPREAELYTKQSAIGWHQILYGRFSNKWADIQSRQEPRHGAPKPFVPFGLFSKSYGSFGTIIFTSIPPLPLTPPSEIASSMLPSKTYSISNRHCLNPANTSSRPPLPRPFNSFALLC